jgi:hypothetical protein
MKGIKTDPIAKRNIYFSQNYYGKSNSYLVIFCASKFMACSLMRALLENVEGFQEI